MKVVAVVQARMGSTRLPGKVVRVLGGKPTIAWVVGAASRAVGVDEVVVATSTNKENDTLEKWCKANKIRCIRGSEDDVLDRYRLVIEETEATAIVRLTGDCPLLDARVIGEVITLYKNQTCDYASNVDPATWPDGLDCEVISSSALLTAALEATRPTDRDTVTRFIARNRSRFKASSLLCPLPDMQKERWVLDSPQDLELIEKIILHFVAECGSNWNPNYLQILDFLNKNPDLRNINKALPRNERFFEAITAETTKREFKRSHLQLDRALSVIPLGSQTFSKSHVQFPAGKAPLYVTHGDGPYVFDIDGNDYVDLVSGLLPNVLGYRDPDVDWAIREQLNNGITFSLATELEEQLADRLTRLIPCAEMVRFGKNGSDATAAAIRVARGFTGRDRVMLIQGNYHGWHDWSIGATDRNLGVPADVIGCTERVSGDLDKIERLLAVKRPKSTSYAAIIIEPEGRSDGYLKRLKNLAIKYGVVLIFDEVITGFRWSLGGYQMHAGVHPDLATFGKAMANGMPISAVVGKSEIMKKFAPPDNVFYSGTFFGETLSIAAAIATIDKLERENVIDSLWQKGRILRDGINKLITQFELGEAIGIHGDDPRTHVRVSGVKSTSKEQIMGAFLESMIAEGVLIINANNMSYPIGDLEIKKILSAYEKTFEKIRSMIDTENNNVIPFRQVSVR